ncbi:helix-turn-helix domain-containing protein [Litorisediminicola beolgyonensis]|uniref:Helix-turn-helix domain-containing protein n=1 Tax=Litorisediminicola beolgyonensis TaxID=1173614 RepID=A0ABW3ZJQ0_9RHOB
MTDAPRIPANIAPFVDVLGVDATVGFLLEFGGAELYFPKAPKRRGRVARLVGIEKARQLAAMSERLPARIPLAKPWLAQVLRSQGLPKSEIARRLRVSDVTVRAYLARSAAISPPDQPDLPF